MVTLRVRLSVVRAGAGAASAGRDAAADGALLGSHEDVLDLQPQQPLAVFDGGFSGAGAQPGQEAFQVVGEFEVGTAVGSLGAAGRPAAFGPRGQAAPRRWSDPGPGGPGRARRGRRRHGPGPPATPAGRSPPAPAQDDRSPGARLTVGGWSSACRRVSQPEHCRSQPASSPSNWLRPDVATSPDRLFCHVYGRGRGQAQMIPGGPYSVIAALERRTPEREESRRRVWQVL